MEMDEDFQSEEEEEFLESEGLDSEALDALEVQLQQALENEDYELASKIRDEINKRKK